ncbi:MAG TPA: ferritin-like domain-containing protein [Vicinamibacterales bacterium]|nr:ferritin-like domain-containing protein [Vicinamibacterales bacterium]
MAKTSTLHDAWLDELRDLYNAEKQISKALPKMVKAATAAPLADAFEAHLQETLKQIQRLEQVFESVGETAKSKTCDGMAGILEEGKDIMSEDFDEPTMDASLIAAAQKVEHYEIASYGTVIAWAEAMGHTQAARLLKQTLGEEEAADEKLTSLATSGINEQAASEAHGEEDEEEETAGVGAGRSRPRSTSPGRGRR